MSSCPRVLAVIALLLAACGGDATSQPSKAPLPSACSHGAADVAPEARAQFVAELRKMLFDFESIAGPALGKAAWSRRRADFRARAEQADGPPLLAGALLELEDGIVKHMPASWVVRRVAWRRALDGTVRFDVLEDSLRELVCASRNAQGLDNDRRERVFRICARITLLMDTCLAAVR